MPESTSTPRKPGRPPSPKEIAKKQLRINEVEKRLEDWKTELQQLKQDALRHAEQRTARFFQRNGRMAYNSLGIDDEFVTRLAKIIGKGDHKEWLIEAARQRIAAEGLPTENEGSDDETSADDTGSDADAAPEDGEDDGAGDDADVASVDHVNPVSGTSGRSAGYFDAENL